MTTTASIDLRGLIGSGHKIGMFALPFLVIGLPLNLVWPAFCEVGGPSDALAVASWTVLALGVVIWAWSVLLIVSRIPRGELITTGPYRLVKHPLQGEASVLHGVRRTGSRTPARQASSAVGTDGTALATLSPLRRGPADSPRSAGDLGG